MAFTLSPGVNVREIDLSTVVPTVATTDCGLVGSFSTGPVDEITLVSSENDLVREFGKPTNSNAALFFTAASFLAYGDHLRLVRVVHSDAVNADADPAHSVLVKNDADFDAKLALGAFSAVASHSAARFPGKYGNALKVSLCPSAQAFSQTITGVDVDVAGVVIAIGAHFTTELAVGSKLLITVSGVQQTRTITVVAGDETAHVDAPFVNSLGVPVAVTGASATAQWEYANLFGVAPGTSDFAASKGGSNDECHVAVVDTDGSLSGVPGELVEKYAFLSKASDAKSVDGASSFFANQINNGSSYVRIINSHLGAEDFGSPASTHFATAIAPVSEVLSGGADGTAITDGDRMLGYDLFTDVETVDISLLAIGDASPAVAAYVISNVAEVRKDCVVLLSPQQSDVVNNANPVAAVLATRQLLGISSSYAVMDSGWKKQYDKYNDVYRNVPLNGDIAGLCVNTDNVAHPWYSPAGLNRGHVKNVIKLAYNPNKSDRDDLYVHGINPVVSFQGQGPVLYGDKTLQSKPSAFDRINVRRLFIVLEKAISAAAKYSLFELNTDFTRAQFKNMVTPFLRDVRASQGIEDFQVVCDLTNNTPEVIATNQFVGDIYIKPTYSINFINLNFVAVRTGVAFSEVVGKF